MSTPQLVWFKKDLRIYDHRPLSEAAAMGPVIAIFVYEDELIASPDFSGRHLLFLNESLEDLSDQLRSLGGTLNTYRGDFVQVIHQLHNETGFTHIHSHQETGNHLSFQRDIAVANWCTDHGVSWNESPQTGVIRRLANRDGWAGRWTERMHQPIVEIPQHIDFHPHKHTVTSRSLSDFKLVESKNLQLQRGGRSEALKLQGSFLSNRGVSYRSGMSSPVTAPECCSRLSPYLTFGCLSIREAYQSAKNQRTELYEQKKAGIKIPPGWFGSLKSYLSRMRWHCHFMQKLEDEPSIEFHNFSRVYDGLRENEWNREFHDAWTLGQTGYPLIDAVMRCLNQTGWINFRMRAMVMSFSSYHLWNHWREPSLHLARVFTDYEPGIHYSQAQMQSGVTGINTIRIYSPIKQAEDQDPDGDFIKTWVPELEGVPNDLINQPHQMTIMEQSLFGCLIGKDYPAPIVDHATAYRSAQQRMFSLRGTREAKIEAARVRTKHGSRKSNTQTWR